LTALRGKSTAAIYAGAPIPFLPVDKPADAPHAAAAVTPTPR